jgi:hypothetical protein
VDFTAVCTSRDTDCVTDWTVLGSAFIAGGAALGGAALQGRGEGRRSAREEAQTRRKDRQAAYAAALDVFSDFLWDAPYASSEYDVLASFTKPFVHAANAVHVHGTPAVVAVIDRIQTQLTELNRLFEDGKTWHEAFSSEYDTFGALFEELVQAARNDVGPLADAPPNPPHIARRPRRRGPHRDR